MMSSGKQNKLTEISFYKTSCCLVAGNCERPIGFLTTKTLSLLFKIEALCLGLNWVCQSFSMRDQNLGKVSNLRDQFLALVTSLFDVLEKRTVIVCLCFSGRGGRTKLMDAS